jgi:hypothetical protein
MIGVVLKADFPLNYPLESRIGAVMKKIMTSVLNTTARRQNYDQKNAPFKPN